VLAHFLPLPFVRRWPPPSISDRRALVRSHEKQADVHELLVLAPFTS